jgi:hypothetical protein
MAASETIEEILTHLWKLVGQLHGLILQPSVAVIGGKERLRFPAQHAWGLRNRRFCTRSMRDRFTPRITPSPATVARAIRRIAPMASSCIKARTSTARSPSSSSLARTVPSTCRKPLRKSNASSVCISKPRVVAPPAWFAKEELDSSNTSQRSRSYHHDPVHASKRESARVWGKATVCHKATPTGCDPIPAAPRMTTAPRLYSTIALTNPLAAGFACHRVQASRRHPAQASRRRRHAPQSRLRVSPRALQPGAPPLPRVNTAVQRWLPAPSPPSQYAGLSRTRNC